MKIAVIAVIIIGALVICNVVSNMSREQCARQCPTNPAAVKQVFEIAGFELVMCNCGEVKKGPE